MSVLIEGCTQIHIAAFTRRDGYELIDRSFVAGVRAATGGRQAEPLL